MSAATTPPRAGGTVAITGATGLVGRHLCQHFRDAGWRVRALGRDSSGAATRQPGIERFECDLPDHIDPRGLAGADALIHCAYTTRPTTLAEARRVNEEGTARLRALWRSCAPGGVFVFISSTSAGAQALSYYGRSKFAIERSLDLSRDLVIRPGLVMAPAGGLFDRLVTSLRRTPMVPVFDGGRQIMQTVYVGDLCAAIGKAIADRRSGRFVVAETEGRTLREFLRLLAERLGRRAWVLSIPSAPLIAALRAAERLGLTLPISSENVLGAIALEFQPSAADLKSLGVEALSFERSLDRVLGPRGPASRA